MSRDQLHPETTYQAVIGRVIVKFRKKLNVDQRCLAETVGVTQSTWSRIERGESSLSIEQLANAAEQLRVYPSTILRETERALEELKDQGVIIRMNKNQNTSGGIAMIGAAVAKIRDSDT